LAQWSNPSQKSHYCGPRVTGSDLHATQQDMIGDDACALKHTPHSTVPHCLCVLGKRSSPLDHAAGEHERACALLWCGNHTPEGGSAFQPPLCPQQSTPLPIALRRAPRATSEVARLVGLELCGGVLLRVRLPIRRHRCRLCPYLTARRSPGPAAVQPRAIPTYWLPASTTLSATLLPTERTRARRAVAWLCSARQTGCHVGIRIVRLKSARESRMP